MLAFVDGRYVPEDSPALSARDRSFMYGDGLFETIRIINAQPFLWSSHLERLEAGAVFLRMAIPIARKEIETAVRHLISQNDASDGVVRIHLSRGVGERGYSPKGADRPLLIITAKPATRALPEKVRVITSSVRVLSSDPLTRHKTANRLPNVLAKIEADEAGVDDALIRNERGEITEASGANVFVIKGAQLLTPPIEAGALPGTTRGFILEKFGGTTAAISNLLDYDGAFLTSAGHLATPIVEADGKPFPIHPLVPQIRKACFEAV
jgi:branched-chain amino acid aminotransferase